MKDALISSFVGLTDPDHSGIVLRLGKSVSPLPSPIVAVTSKKNTHQTHSLMLRNPPLAARLTRLSDNRAIHNPDRPTDSFIAPMNEVFPKQFDTQEAQPLLAAQAFEQGDI